MVLLQEPIMLMPYHPLSHRELPRTMVKFVVNMEIPLYPSPLHEL